MQLLIFLAVLAYSIYFMKSVKKNSSKDSGLTKAEKIKVIASEALNPLIAGAIYYYGWRKQLPQKANQANKYSFIIFGAYILFGVILVLISILVK
jgi:Na+-transporting methylmalonyl-CoA/oxaloacetate decarboxylase gamma subunit